jgi:hypothetical protein
MDPCDTSLYLIPYVISFGVFYFLGATLNPILVAQVCFNVDIMSQIISHAWEMKPWRDDDDAVPNPLERGANAFASGLPSEPAYDRRGHMALDKTTGHLVGYFSKTGLVTALSLHSNIFDNRYLHFYRIYYGCNAVFWY